MLDKAHLLQEWDRLAQSMPTHMPFQSVHWNRTWWNRFKRDGVFFKDELYLLCVMRDARLIGIVPLFRTTIGLPGIPVFRYMRMLGADANLTEWRSVICRSEDRLALQAIWLRHMAEYKFGLFFAQIRGFTADEIAAANFENVGFVKMMLPSENFILALPANWESFKTKLKRNIKESLRHCYNSLDHSGLIPSLTVIGNAPVLRRKMELFYQWHALRAQNVGTVYHPDYFKDKKHRVFLDELADGLCPLGQMKLFELNLNGQPVAYRLGFINGNTLYLYFSAFDPTFSKFSTMTTLIAEVIKWAIDNRLKFVNLSFGRDVSKTRWGPLERQFYDALIGTRGIFLLQTYRWMAGRIAKLKRSIGSLRIKKA
ncbi:MAG: GNAT family N-acetyltransferase [Pseudomonadota bacterium]